MDEINVNELEKIIRSILEANNLQIRPTYDSRGNTYQIETEEAVYKITVGSAWIGYEFSVNKGVLKKGIGSSLDTDSYPIDKNLDISMEIFNESIECLIALLEGRILVGHEGSKPLLAIPISNEKYKLLRRNVFSLDNRIVNSSMLSNYKNLRILK